MNTYCSRCQWDWRTSGSQSGPIVALQEHHATVHTVVRETKRPVVPYVKRLPRLQEPVLPPLCLYCGRAGRMAHSRRYGVFCAACRHVAAVAA